MHGEGLLIAMDGDAAGSRPRAGLTARLSEQVLTSRLQARAALCLPDPA